MPERKYHNLEGWLRDVEHLVHQAGALDDAGARLWDRVADALDSFAPEAMESGDDDAVDTTDDNQDGVDGPLFERREADAPRPRRHDAGSAHERAPSRGLERRVDDVPGSERAPEESGVAQVRDGGVGDTAPGLTVATPIARYDERNRGRRG